MEPRDLKFDAMSFKINDPKRDCIRTVHKDGWCAGFADGSVHCMNKNIDPDILKCLLTIDGRGDGAKRLERIDWSELEVP
jgi:hypothetical protein